MSRQTLAAVLFYFFTFIYPALCLWVLPLWLGRFSPHYVTRRVTEILSGFTCILSTWQTFLPPGGPGEILTQDQLVLRIYYLKIIPILKFSFQAEH